MHVYEAFVTAAWGSYLGLVSFLVDKLASYSWRLIGPRYLGLGLPIGPFGRCATLGLNLYTLPHEVVRRLHLRPFRPISVLRGVLRVRIGCFWKRNTALWIRRQPTSPRPAAVDGQFLTFRKLIFHTPLYAVGISFCLFLY